MKRDMELIRDILMRMESYEHGYFRANLEIEECSEEMIDFHCYLIHQAGLAAGNEVTDLHSKSPRSALTHLTWKGYEFLDASRDDEVWRTAQTRVGTAVESVSFAVLTQLLVHLAKQKLGIA